MACDADGTLRASGRHACTGSHLAFDYVSEKIGSWRLVRLGDPMLQAREDATEPNCATTCADVIRCFGR